MRASAWARAGTLVALLALAPAPGRAAVAAATTPEDPSRALHDLGRDFELGRQLAGADRVAALSATDQALATLRVSDLDAEARVAARMLAGAVKLELGDYAAAREAFGHAADMAGRDAPGADAAFAEIQALEATGQDEEAARDWAKWEKRYPGSPLIAEARLAEARNSLRRGRVAEARATLARLLAVSPWMKSDSRAVLTQALALYLDHKPSESLELLGSPRAAGTAGLPSAASPAATYLAALDHAALGERLQAAALFQQTAERAPNSPLRDHALLAKANAFLASRDDRSAAEEFARVATLVSDPGVRAEAELRSAGARFLSGDADSAAVLLRGIVERYPKTDVAARAQFLVGEALVAQGRHAEAIVELNRVLTDYFQHEVAASAQYQVARCLDQLGRQADATGAYQAVVRGYSLAPEAPAAAYLAGVGLMRQNRPLAAAPYFQIVLDRYAPRPGATPPGASPSGATSDGAPAHATAPAPAVAATPVPAATPAAPGNPELVDAALCMLEFAYHRAGNLGQLSGAPHLLLQQLPPSRSPWRARALLVDADASASQGRFAEAQLALERLAHDFPDQPVAASALKLLAWCYAQQGRDSLAIACEERLLQRHAASASEGVVSGAFLDIAHERFNQKRYREAAGAYEDFVRRYPDSPKKLEALYQCGLCYLRLDRAGDAVDRWEAIVRDSAGAAIAERAWARMGDVYFQAEKYADAKRSYHGLLEHFQSSRAAALASLRLAQCEYNAGHDADALQGFSATIATYPNTPEAREAQRGTELALYRLSRSPEGPRVLAQLVEQFPGSAFAADAMFEVARRDYQEKRWDKAVDGFRRVVSQFPAYSAADQAQFMLADAQAQAGRAAEARQAYEQFLSYFPSSTLASTVEFRLGLLAFQAKDFSNAAVAFTRALTDSASAEVRSASRYNLALSQRMLGDPASARATLEQHQREFASDARAADVAFQLGDLDEAEGRTTDALEQYARALAARPRPSLVAEASYRTGHAREQLGQTEAALRAYTQAAASSGRDDPYRLSAVARVAALCEARKDYPRALAAYRDIMRNTTDRELAAAAAGRVAQLESVTRR